MGKLDFRRLKAKTLSQLENELLSPFRVQGQQREGIELLLALLAYSERIMLARRIQIAKLLIQGKALHEIAKNLRVGETTVRSMDRWLATTFHDYRKILPTVIKEHKKHSSRDHLLRTHHPLHFLLIDLLSRSS